jgi:hypothetical protein
VQGTAGTSRRPMLPRRPEADAQPSFHGDLKGRVLYLRAVAQDEKGEPVQQEIALIPKREKGEGAPGPRAERAA